MPVPTPITLTATLKSTFGDAAKAGAKLKITLAGYDNEQPEIPGHFVLSDLQKTLTFQAAALSTQLYGNDVISPAGTFYLIQTFDADGNCIAAGEYRITGAAARDLSSLAPLQTGQPLLFGAVPNGKMPGVAFTLPIAARAAGAALAFFNGSLQTLDNFIVNGQSFMPKFNLAAEDRLFVMYQADHAPSGFTYEPFVAIANGQTPGDSYTLPTLPPGAQFVGMFQNGLYLTPGSYSNNGHAVHLVTPTEQPTDTVYALYLIGAEAVAIEQPAGLIPGQVYTLSAAPRYGALLFLFNRATFLRPGIDYTFAGQTITLTTATADGDVLNAIYVAP